MSANGAKTVRMMMDVVADDDGGGDIATVATRAEQSAVQSTLDPIARKAIMKERLMEKLREEKEVERESGCSE